MSSASTRVLTIGTRASALAMWQAGEVSRRLPVPSVLKRISTSGDRFRDVPLQGGEKTGFFTKEIQELLLSGAIDVAVHSLKDLPTAEDPRLRVAACLPRAPVSDLLLVHPDWLGQDALLPLRPGCTVGAGSLRRQALLRLYCPGVTPALIRGNVPTRVRKCRERTFGAVVLARAGIERLELDLAPLLVFELNPLLWLPAPGQGAVAVEVRGDDAEALAAAAAINHEATMDAVFLERELLSRFEGGCHTAFGAYAVREQPSDIWRVLVGMDRPGAGWGQTVYEGSRASCVQHGPAELPGFQPLCARRQEELCRPFRQ